jgi:uncharacterized beta-barrel protein YwiB (DUF1934 family)
MQVVSVSARMAAAFDKRTAEQVQESKEKVLAETVKKGTVKVDDVEEELIRQSRMDKSLQFVRAISTAEAVWLRS